MESKYPCEDNFGQPLQTYPLLTKIDTLWACLAVRIHGRESLNDITAMKITLMLHFVAILYGIVCDTLEEARRNIATLQSRIDHPECFRHLAIQSWMNTGTTPRKFAQRTDADDIKSKALQFIRQNTMPGTCTCVPTVLYLFASRYSYNVQLWNNGRLETFNYCDRLEFEHVIRPEYCVYLTFNSTQFNLLLPIRHLRMELSTTTTPLSSRRKMHQYNVTTATRSIQCNQADRFVYYCQIPTEFNGQILLFHVESGKKKFLSHSVYVFTCASVERTEQCSLVGYGNQTEQQVISFLLDTSIVQWVVLVEMDNLQNAEKCLQEEMKLRIKGSL